MSEPAYEDPVVAEIHAIRAQMLAECGGDFERLMKQVSERERASGRTVIPAPPAAPGAKPLTALVHTSVANGSVGASTARGMPRRTVGIARAFLRELDLGGFARTASEGEFRALLDSETEKLRRELEDNQPEPGDKGRYWGPARKYLNIFLRDALYNYYLREHYDLARIEPFLEVPLDGSVGKGLYDLHKKEGGTDLLPWRAIQGLKKEESDKYQEFARLVADAKRYARVHLDLWFYRAGESERAPGASPQGMAEASVLLPKMEPGARIHIRSPRLADPSKAAELLKIEMIEEGPDAGPEPEGP